MTRIRFFLPALTAALLILGIFTIARARQTGEGFILEKESMIAKKEKGPHNGGGETAAYSFFAGAENFDLAFRKRVLFPGSSIGYHLQQGDEIYYILSGRGLMTVNGKTFDVAPGDAVLTRPGNSHGLRPTNNDTLVLIINYKK